MWIREVCVEDGRYGVSARIIRCGQDVSVTVGGGEQPHLGAAALAGPRPSLRDPNKVSASTSVLCVPGHKEDAFVRRAAEQIASACNCVASVCAGVHVDRADPEELSRLARNLERLLQIILEQLENPPGPDAGGRTPSRQDLI